MNTGDIQISLPASKSLSNRWLVVNHLAGGAFALQNLSNSDDTRLLRQLLTQLREKRQSVYYCNNAGTVARFLIALLATQQGTHLVTGDERLRQRPVADLVEALRSMGFNITYTATEGQLPVQIVGCQPLRKMVSVQTSHSSQFASALLLAGLAMPQGISVSLVGRIASRPYIDLTIDVLRQAGASISESPNRHLYMVAPPAAWPQRPPVITMESDWTAASYFYSIAALFPSLRLRLRNISTDSQQGDRVVDKIFHSLGVDVQTVRSPYRRDARSLVLCAKGKLSPTLKQSFTDCPDLFPTVAVACAALGIDATLRGLRNLRLKESDRIEAVSSQLQALGCRLTVTDNVLHLYPSTLHPINVIHTHGDHRIAMAFAPLMLRYPEMTIDHPEVVSKSFPTFWQCFEQIKAQVEKLTATT